MIEIEAPKERIFDEIIEVPGSKYIANRVIIIAALAEGESEINNVPFNEDIETAIEGFKSLGIQIEKDFVNKRILVKGNGGDFSWNKQAIFTKDSGTFSRFLTPLIALNKEVIKLYGSERMNERPMKDLFEALRSLGVNINSLNERLPAEICGPLKGGSCHLNGSISSQYFSALLLSIPYAKEDTIIKASSNIISKNYIDMTISLMKDFSVNIEQELEDIFSVKHGQKYKGRSYNIEPDPVSSTYFLAIPALLKESKISIKNYNKDSLQGEKKFANILEKMGCKVSYNQRGITVSSSNKPLNKIGEISMGNMPDAVQTLCVIASCISGRTKITDIAHLRYKESNRIEDTVNELKKVGCNIKAGKDFIEIEGNSSVLKSGIINSKNGPSYGNEFKFVKFKNKED